MLLREQLVDLLYFNPILSGPQDGVVWMWEVI